MRLLVWLVRALVFFTLFAFALNNQHVVGVHWFFGHQWQAPMVFVVLVAFAVGCAFGVFAMVPAWWRHRRVARRTQDLAPALPVPAANDRNPPTVPAALDHPPRDGL